MTKLKQTNYDSQLARTLAAEDIRQGDLVTILDVIVELPSYLWNENAHMLPPDETVPVRWRAVESGQPLKVKAICLPYVLVKPPRGKHETIDIRRCQLVRLSGAYAKKAWEAFRDKDKKKKKKRKKK